jgi:ABC-type iron transport system FetAB permease component
MNSMKSEKVFLFQKTFVALAILAVGISYLSGFKDSWFVIVPALLMLWLASAIVQNKITAYILAAVMFVFLAVVVLLLLVNPFFVVERNASGHGRWMLDCALACVEVISLISFY